MPGKILLRFQCKRLVESDMPWRNRDCLFFYLTYDKRLAFVGRAVGGQTVASFWGLHELESHAVTRQIIKAFGGVMGMAVYVATPVRILPDVSLGDMLIQAERVLVREFSPPGNRSTTEKAMAEAAAAVPRDDLVVRFEGWPVGEGGSFER